MAENNEIKNIMDIIFKNNHDVRQKIAQYPFDFLLLFGITFDECNFGMEEDFEIVYLLHTYFSQKYDNNFIVAKKSLNRLMRNHYKLIDLEEDNIPFEFRPSQLNFSNKFLEIQKVTLISPGKSDRKHITEFLEDISDKDNFFFPIFSEEYNTTRKYKVKYMDSINFLLYYIYQDGRIIKRSAIRMPKFKLTTSCSKSSQKVVFSQILQLFHISEHFKKNKIDKLFALVQLYNIDRIFSVFKIQKMVFQYMKFMSFENLEEIYNHFDFTYLESKNFEKSFIDEVFENEEFIAYCLKCNYHNPLYIFYLVFRSFLHFKYYRPKNISYFIDYEPDVERHDISLKEIIIAAREETIKVIDMLIDRTNSKVEKTISKFLEQNSNTKSDIFSEIKSLLKLSDNTSFNNCSKGIDNLLTKGVVYEYFYEKDLIEDYINLDDHDNPYKSESEFDEKRYFEKLCEISRKILPSPIFKK